MLVKQDNSYAQRAEDYSVPIAVSQRRLRDDASSNGCSEESRNAANRIEV
jgi:hypothetical protein